MKRILSLIVVAIVFVISMFVYYNFTMDSIGSKCRMTRLAFSNEEEELKWEEEYNDCVKQANATKIRFEKYSGIEKGIMIFCAIVAISVTVVAARKKQKITIHAVLSSIMVVLTLLILLE